MKSIILYAVALLMMVGCHTKTKQDDSANIVKTTQEKTVAPPVGKTCFAYKMISPMDSNEHNYILYTLDTDENMNVKGYYIASPFGTDGSRGILNGVYNKTKNSFDVKTTSYSEGEMYEEPYSFPYLDQSLSLGFVDENNQPVTIPKVTCGKFDSILTDYNRSCMKYTINTEDRSLLKTFSKKNNIGLSMKQIEEVPFMEVALDLDNKYDTEEHLLYIMDPSICGSGGCNLYITASDGKLIHKLTVTKMPIYIPLTIPAESGKWSDLYVYSGGSMRKISHTKGKYATNPSLEAPIDLDSIISNPHLFALVMDYID